MAIKTFIHEFRPFPFLYGPHFNPATDRYLTPAEQESHQYQQYANLGYDLTRAGYRVEYTGKVLGTFERNGYDDSDFVAYVELAPGKFGQVEYNSTRHAGGGVAEVDATDDVHDRYWVFRDEFWARAAELREADEVTVARVGKTVTVIGGRKYRGREGTIGWIGEAFRQWRARVVPEDGEAFFVPLNFTDLPDHENTSDKIQWALAENFRGAPQTRGSKVTAG